MGRSLTTEQLKADWSELHAALGDPSRWEVFVRVDRCLSWLEHYEELRADGWRDPDTSLVFLWIGFSALLGRRARGKVEKKRDAMGRLLATLDAHDREQWLDRYLAEQLDLSVRPLVSDEGLTDAWWNAAGRPGVPPHRDREWGRVQSLVASGKTTAAAKSVLLRVYLARCQIVHGGARCNSKLNRQAMTCSTRFLEGFLRRTLRIVIDGAYKADWTGVSYPPPAEKMAVRGTHRVARARSG